MFASGDQTRAAKLDNLSEDTKRHAVFLLLVYVPIVCAVFQLLAWSQFTLQGKRLSLIKRIREGALYAHV